MWFSKQASREVQQSDRDVVEKIAQMSEWKVCMGNEEKMKRLHLWAGRYIQ